MAEITLEYPDDIAFRSCYVDASGDPLYWIGDWNTMIDPDWENPPPPTVGDTSNPGTYGLLQIEQSGVEEWKWVTLTRSYFGIDLSDIPGGATILSATLKIKCDMKVNSADWDDLWLNIVQLTEAPDPEEKPLFVIIGNTELCDTPVTYEAWDIGDWNNFELNAAGLALVQAGVGTGCYLGMKEITYDKGYSPPEWTGEGQAFIKPDEVFEIELVVVYSTGFPYSQAQIIG